MVEGGKVEASSVGSSQSDRNSYDGDAAVEEPLTSPRSSATGYEDPLSRNLVTEQEVAMLYYEASRRGRSHTWFTGNGAKDSKCMCSKSKCSLEAVKSFFPFLGWLPGYDYKENLKFDVMAGLTVGIILIPQGISYGLLADLPPQYGLYACLAAPIMYSLMGTCVQLQIGPFALISLLIANTVSKVVDPEDEEKYVQAVLTCSILIGALLMIMGLLRMGSLVNFLSVPVISGLTTGGAFLIMTSQVSHFFGLTIPRGAFYTTWYLVFKNIGEINVATLIIGLLSLMVLVGFRFFKETETCKKLHLRHLPVALIVMVTATLISWGADLQDRFGVQVLGDVPAGIPAPRFPTGFDMIGELMVPVLVISIVGYAISMATSKTFASKNNYEVNANQELFALGIANLMGGMFNGYPAFSSLSRSALVHEMGAKTPLHNAVSALMIVLVLLFLTKYLYSLPYACLSAIIFDSLKSLFMQLKDPIVLWKTDKADMIVWLVTFIAVLVLDIAIGLAVGVGFSILLLLYSVANPSWAVMGRFPKMNWIYKDISRFEDTELVPGVVVFRFDGALHFANRECFKKSILKTVRDRVMFNPLDRIHSVVLDASSMTDCDSSGLQALAKVRSELSEQGIELIMCSCRGHFRDILKRCDLLFQEYVSLNDAVCYAEGKRVIRDYDEMLDMSGSELTNPLPSSGFYGSSINNLGEDLVETLSPTIVEGEGVGLQEPKSPLQ
mmetsp:Transcript_10486/g.17092  ORF Transcript_10486/g.17092 Transcript_10486/m.17092 type:complete len:725 (-) Transcript_10486:46-2220(-)